MDEVPPRCQRLVSASFLLGAGAPLPTQVRLAARLDDVASTLTRAGLHGWMANTVVDLGCVLVGGYLEFCKRDAVRSAFLRVLEQRCSSISAP